MENDILEAIKHNEDMINVLQSQIAFIKSLDTTKPVDEITWHNICETPLRSSSLLPSIVKVTFPNSENIKVLTDYVSFDLLGFRVQIPTSRCSGISVDTSWYVIDCGEPEPHLTELLENMNKNFDEWDGRVDRWILSHIRLRIAVKGQELAKIKEHYHKERLYMRYRVNKLQNELLPILNKFSENHYVYHGASCQYSIDEIISFEKDSTYGNILYN